MKIQINNVEILDPNSPYHKTKKSILIEDGMIRKISDEPSVSDKSIEGSKLMVSPGWVDMRVSMGDPGMEHREDIASVARAAAFGGFTEILCLPNTKPTIHSKELISYIKTKAQNELVTLHVAAAVTYDRLGKDLTEMIDLHHAGAIAFTDGDKPIWHTDIFLKTLQYLQTFDGLLIDHSEELLLTHSGQMNEGINSTLLGLKGLPKIAEEIVVERNLKILEYTGGRLHFAHISSPLSLQKIKEAKDKGYNVTCDIAAYQLALDDEYCKTFDTNYKVNPPLRTKSDITFFWKALKENIIDVIVSDHIPQDEESKNVEFDVADFGMIGLETVFPLLSGFFPGEIDFETLVQKLSINPRKILKLPVPRLQEGELANITVFDPEMKWKYEARNIKSKSRNTPFINSEFKGKVVAVFNKGKYILN